jgi:arsenical pump membrane protein
VSAADVHAAFAQAWPAFALVAGLLLIGAAAAREGLFAAAGAAVARGPGGPFALLAGLLVVEALVTAVLNLDTAVVFMTPVLLHAARGRGIPDAPFLYGAVFMANSASLLLPGSNLTNVIVLANEHVSGATFAARLAPAWIVSVAITIVFVAVVFRRSLRGHDRRAVERPAFRPGAGTAGVAVSAVLVLVLSRPALPVLALGVLVVVLAGVRLRDAVRAANPMLLLGVLAAAVLLGAFARAVRVDRLVSHAGRWETAGIAVVAAGLVNNLPAAVMLSARLPPHPRALLLGLNLGPNLVVTGSLSAILWLQVARTYAAKPSILRYTQLGIVLVPLTLAASLLVTRL